MKAVHQTPKEIRHRVHNSGAPWALRETGGTLRFEVRPGDHWSTDGSGKERSELYYPQKFDLRRTYDLGFALMVERGPGNTASWLTLAQLQSTFDPQEPGHSPPFAIELRGEKMRIISRDSAAKIASPKDTSYRFHFEDRQSIKRGRWYRMKLRVRFDPGQDGLLQVWRDGRQIVDYKGPIGFEDAVGPYLKLGVYRDVGPKETLAVRFRDLKMGPVAAGSASR